MTTRDFYYNHETRENVYFAQPVAPRCAQPSCPCPAHPFSDTAECAACTEEGWREAYHEHAAAGDHGLAAEALVEAERWQQIAREEK